LLVSCQEDGTPVAAGKQRGCSVDYGALADRLTLILIASAFLGRLAGRSIPRRLERFEGGAREGGHGERLVLGEKRQGFPTTVGFQAAVRTKRSV
jgi:hypothetical protein